MRRLERGLAQRLAGEYVLGTLRGRARARFEAHMRADPAVATLVRQWETRLTPLAERVPPVAAPARVWRAIEARIAPRGRAEGAGPWRSLGLLAGGAASVLFAAFLWFANAPREEPMFVAVLTAPDAVPRLVVSMHEPDRMRVRMVKPWGGMEGQSLELWVVPQQGAPRSLGLVPNRVGETTIRVRMDDPRVKGANALAVSMEPAGGSPTGRPTAVVCSGMIAPGRRT